MLLMLRVVQIRWTRTWAERGGRARVETQRPSAAASSGLRPARGGRA